MRFLVATLFVFASPVFAMTDAEVKEAVIRESLANYSGSCPCPYNVTRNGRLCGGRSAYTRPGGKNPICYPSDVTSEMIRRYRQR